MVVPVVITALLATVASSAALGQGPASAADTVSSAVTKTVTATRTHLVNGADVVADSRKVTVSVSATTNLRDQQSVTVSWTGAHPSANVPPDPNSDNGSHSEYPMVILQCRGIDSATAPVAKRVSPQTCWTPYFGSQSQLNGQGSDSRDVDTGSYPAWRLDRYADQADRQRFSHEPTTTAPLCPNTNNAAEYRLPFLAASGIAYYGSGAGQDVFCGQAPPEAASFTGGDSTASNLPDNATFAGTDVDGTGSTPFNVRDDHTNASLGCSSTVPCSLVAIPVEGISCDAGAGLPVADRPVGTVLNPDLPANAEAECEQQNFFAPGSIYKANPGENYAVSGALWWSASNWRNRVSVPLQFAPPSNVCDLVSTKTPVNVYGSELLIQATTQWSAEFCLDAQRDPFRHVQYSDTQARNLLTQTLQNPTATEGQVQAIFDSYPPTSPYPKPVVHAPVAATGFALSYAIDDSAKQPYTKLRLTPRLLAKLLTESYPSRDDLRQLYTYDAGYYGKVDPMKSNPINITFDPEFKALNPGIDSNSSSDTGARAALLSIGSNSDVMRALTTYINADPEARAWLDGTPDPWGMVVNPNYRGISLPVDTMPLLDTYAFPAGYGADGTCTQTIAPVPYLPLVQAPISRLSDIAQAVQYSVPGSQTRCSVAFDPLGNSFYQWARAQRQSVGFRFLIGVTSLADAKRYGLQAAALQTHSTADATAKITDATGRTFVQPTQQALLATAHLLRFADDSTGWPVPYDQLNSTAGSTAYPGFMLVYLDVASTGVQASDAKAYSALLSYLAGPGQQPGDGVGQLPEGYLPLTAANGLGSLAAYTLRAAGIVAAQGRTAATTQAPSTPTPTVTTGAAPAPVDSTATTGASASPATGGKVAAPRTSGSTAPALKSLGNTARQSSPIAQNLLYVLLALLLLGPVVAPISLIVLRRRTAK
ncbi:hypothetical protein BH10ACT8_BH10ACT8_18320 [soil metagenome]